LRGEIVYHMLLKGRIELLEVQECDATGDDKNYQSW